LPPPPTAAPPFRLSLPAADPGASRAGLAVVLGAALAVRLWIVFTHTYVIWPDETFQYLEPAHRLAFGSGVVTWEFLDGIRSWLLPGIIAGVMRAVAAVDPDPAAYVLVLRLQCVVASLAVPFVGYRMAARRCGPMPAMLAGLFSALASETVYFAPVIMTEPLATDAALLAIWFGDGARDRADGRRRLLFAGLLFGIAASLRYQYAPVLALVALLQHVRDRRGLAIVALGGGGVVVLALGALDTLTWGVPFQSVWLNYLRNATQGVSGAMGTQAWFFYPAYWLVAWGAAGGLLMACAVYGAVRVPLLGVVAVGTMALHALAPHKELRFVFLATACMPTLAGAGLGCLLQRVRALRPPSVGAPVAAAVALALAGYTAYASYGEASPRDAWHRHRSLLQATAAARDYAPACGLAFRAPWLYHTGGYSYWHRNAPIYFQTWDEAQELPGSTFRLRLESVLDGKPVPQFPGTSLAEHADRFNVIIGAPGEELPKFSGAGCFGSGGKDDPTYCVFTRPGGCG
jgi:hypothetical protein